MRSDGASKRLNPRRIRWSTFGFGIRVLFAELDWRGTGKGGPVVLATTNARLMNARFIIGKLGFAGRSAQLRPVWVGGHNGTSDGSADQLPERADDYL
jgi:hypothetical protein